jgi:hypothetical protein
VCHSQRAYTDTDCNTKSYSFTTATPDSSSSPDTVVRITYAKFYSRSHDAVIRVYDETGNVIETHENVGEFKEW